MKRNQHGFNIKLIFVTFILSIVGLDLSVQTVAAEPLYGIDLKKPGTFTDALDNVSITGDGAELWLIGNAKISIVRNNRSIPFKHTSVHIDLQTSSIKNVRGHSLKTGKGEIFYGDLPTASNYQSETFTVSRQKALEAVNYMHTKNVGQFSISEGPNCATYAFDVLEKAGIEIPHTPNHTLSVETAIAFKECN